MKTSIHSLSMATALDHLFVASSGAQTSWPVNIVPGSVVFDASSPSRLVALVNNQLVNFKFTEKVVKKLKKRWDRVTVMLVYSLDDPELPFGLIVELLPEYEAFDNRPPVYYASAGSVPDFTNTKPITINQRKAKTPTLGYVGGSITITHKKPKNTKLPRAERCAELGRVDR